MLKQIYYLSHGGTSTMAVLSSSKLVKSLSGQDKSAAYGNIMHCGLSSHSLFCVMKECAFSVFFFFINFCHLMRKKMDPA